MIVINTVSLISVAPFLLYTLQYNCYNLFLTLTFVSLNTHMLRNSIHTTIITLYIITFNVHDQFLMPDALFTKNTRDFSVSTGK